MKNLLFECISQKKPAKIPAGERPRGKDLAPMILINYIYPCSVALFTILSPVYFLCCGCCYYISIDIYNVCILFISFVEYVILNS